MEKYEYNYCALLIWGCIPIDRNWAEGTSIFKTKSIDILKSYDFKQERIQHIKMKEIRKNTKVEKIDVVKELDFDLQIQDIKISVENPFN